MEESRPSENIQQAKTGFSIIDLKNTFFSKINNIFGPTI